VIVIIKQNDEKNPPHSPFKALATQIVAPRNSTLTQFAGHDSFWFDAFPESRRIRSTNSVLGFRDKKTHRSICAPPRTDARFRPRPAGGSAIQSVLRIDSPFTGNLRAATAVRKS
jgi:hypothetical protein